MSDVIQKRYFVLGCDRSGTSVLRRILNAHSAIACPAETKFIYQLLKIIQTEQSYTGLTAMGFDRKQILAQHRKFINGFMDAYARMNNKNIWIEKTTHSLFYVDLLDEIYAHDMKYIGLVRHGLDVAYSLENVKHSPFTVIDQFAEEGDDRAAIAARFWKAQNAKLLELKQRFNDRIKIFKYEDMTSDPEKTFKAMFDYIGVPYEADAVNQFNQKAHTGGYEDPAAVRSEKLSPNSQKYKLWDQEKQKKLFNLAGKELNAFGYTL